MLQNRNSNYKKFPQLKTTLIAISVTMVTLVIAFPWLYEVKTKAGINISKSRHAGTFLEKHTGGIFRCEWLYPYRCRRPFKN
ncbi:MULTISPECIES: hypothetical protein [unclassified Anabaena]|uniref:hypothetical protein n=1 Tax=unclassified Anabaena TaxID=2619674 RepID=UPI00082B231A|nr:MULTISPECIES: hypothetical protein [unclassified Anabaena]